MTGGSLSKKGQVKNVFWAPRKCACLCTFRQSKASYLTASLSRGSSQSRSSGRSGGSTLTNDSVRSLFSRLTLRKRRSQISVDPFSLGAKSVPGVMTHSRSRQTTETTLTTLSGETYDTTLSSNTLRSRGTSGALNKMPQQAVSNDT